MWSMPVLTTAPPRLRVQVRRALEVVGGRLRIARLDDDVGVKPTPQALPRRAELPPAVPTEAPETALRRSPDTEPPPPPEPPTPPETALPAGWKQASAPDGRAYYYAAKGGGATQWTRPTEPAAPEPAHPPADAVPGGHPSVLPVPSTAHMPSTTHMPSTASMPSAAPMPEPPPAQLQPQPAPPPQPSTTMTPQPSVRAPKPTPRRAPPLPPAR